MKWNKIIQENKPTKFKGYPIQVSLRNTNEEWNGFDFHPKDLPYFYNGEDTLMITIYKKGFKGEYGDMIDTVFVNLTPTP